MSGFSHAVAVFFDQVSAVAWPLVALALLAHVGKIAARTRAWRNIIQATYPETRVPWRGVLGAYVAGVGVNAILPARGGDLIKLHLVKRRVRGSTYPTLASTLVVDTAFDAVVATGLLAWAISTGALPGGGALPHFPAFDWSWMVRHLAAAGAIGAGVLLIGFVLAARVSRHVGTLRQRVAQGFVIWRQPGLYLRSVVTWQVLDWVFRITTIYLFLLAFGIVGNLHNAFLVQVTSGISTVVPFTPAGIGTEQALLVFIFAGSVATGKLLAFSVGMKAILVLFNLIVGFGAIVLVLRTLRWRRRVSADLAPKTLPALVEDARAAP